jgi:hypothetical protein
MIRRLLIPLLGSGLLLAAGASTALAKCEGPNPPDFCKQVVASLNVRGGGGVIHAGTRASVDISISQGEQSFEATSVVLVFSRSDGTVERAYATAAAVPGLWSADLLLPDDGSWNVMAQVFDAYGNASLVPIQTSWGDALPVLPPVPSAAKPVTAPPVSPAPPALPIALMVAGLAAAALLAFAMRERSRRRSVGASGATTATAGAVNSDRA